MRIQQNTNFLIDLLRSATTGRLVPAAFQRPYAWSREDVEAFWTSLMRGWPIGSMLIWEPGRDTDMSRIGKTRLGPIMAEGSAEGIILDGQNRLASFAWSMRAPGDPLPDLDLLSTSERETWATGDILVLDPELKAARFAPEADISGDRFLLPAGWVTGSHEFWDFVRKRSDEIEVRDEDLNWLDKVGGLIREARCTSVVLERASPAEAIEAFRHIARAGVPMSETDFETAVSWSISTDPAPKV